MRRRALLRARRHPRERRGCAPTASRAPPAAAGRRRSRATSLGSFAACALPHSGQRTPLAAVLDHLDRRSAAAPRPGGVPARPADARSALGEDVAAAAALGPVLDHLIHRPRRQQLAARGPRGRAGRPPYARSGSLPRGEAAARWIGARRARGVARVLRQLALELLRHAPPAAGCGGPSRSSTSTTASRPAS